MVLAESKKLSIQKYLRLISHRNVRVAAPPVARPRQIPQPECLREAQCLFCRRVHHYMLWENIRCRAEPNFLRNKKIFNTIKSNSKRFREHFLKRREIIEKVMWGEKKPFTTYRLRQRYRKASGRGLNYGARARSPLLLLYLIIKNLECGNRNGFARYGNTDVEFDAHSSRPELASLWGVSRRAAEIPIFRISPLEVINRTSLLTLETELIAACLCHPKRGDTWSRF
ncbi:Protein of unknown function [Gryllus bimaculatus]|nr:Protein of unknown function [Gryllus bimaculatus]